MRLATMNIMDLFDQRLLDKIGNRLKAKKNTIAVAESVTAGLLQFALASIEEASNFFQGGFTVYNIGQKYKHLNVEPIHAESVNCVSQQVSNQMAVSVQEKFCSDWGIGITGYATPVPESDNKLFAYFAISRGSKILAKGKLNARPGKPIEVQVYYTEVVLKKLAALL
jgi:nicotinamide-nucleotide amidase